MVPKKEKQRAQARTEPVDEDKFKATVKRLLDTPPQHKAANKKKAASKKTRPSVG
jgi:hypothetical protein